jgi:Ca2+-binding EF-hand superfamily protein
MLEPKFYRYCLSEEQVSEYKASFDKWVVKSSKKLGQRKTIDYSELNTFLKHLGFSISESELHHGLESLGLDRNRLGFAEIVRFIGRYTFPTFRRSMEEEL